MSQLTFSILRHCSWSRLAIYCIPIDLIVFLTTFLWVQCFLLPYKDFSLNIMLWPCLHLSQTRMTGQISAIPHPPLGVYKSHCKCYFVSGGEFCYLQQLDRVTREAYLVPTWWKWWMLPFFYVLFGQRSFSEDRRISVKRRYLLNWKNKLTTLCRFWGAFS